MNDTPNRASAHPAAPLAALAPAAVAAALPGCLSDGMKHAEVRTFRLTPAAPVALDIRSDHGDVSVAPADTPAPRWARAAPGGAPTDGASEPGAGPGEGEIMVHARLRAGRRADLEAATLEPIVANGALRLETRWRGRGEHGTDYAVRLSDSPRGVSIDTGYGDAEARVVGGPVRISTGHGDTLLREVTGGAHVESGYGDLDVSNIGDGLTLRTGHGDVDATSIAGGFTIETGYGDVGASDIKGPVRISTDHGDVTLEALAPGNSGITVDSGYGDLRVALPAALAGRIAASTGFGDITIRTPGGRSIGTTIDVQLPGGDGPTHTFETGSGDITIDAETALGSAPPRR